MSDFGDGVFICVMAGALVLFVWAATADHYEQNACKHAVKFLTLTGHGDLGVQLEKDGCR